MLPIPVPIIGSNKRLFIPLIYLAVTASICYLFLIAFIKVNKHYPNHSSPRSTFSKIERYYYHHPPGKYKREIFLNLLYETTTPITKQVNLSSDISSWKSKKRKEKDKKIVEEDISGQHGTWRSNSTQIRIGHQDLNYHHHIWLIDETSPSHQPWPFDQQCKSFRTNFAKKNTFKPRALVSFPGSGNSWLRYLIECSTGLFTGSVYTDRIIFSNGLLGESRPPNDGSTIVQKTHHDTTYLSSHRTRQAYVKLTELIFGYRGILLIRNPYDALISYWNFIKTKDKDRHRGHADEQNFSNSEWTYFVTESIQRWSSLITSWVDNSESYLIVEYEKLKKNPREELIRILKYLEQSGNESRLDCLLKVEHLEGPFHRNQHLNDSCDPSEKNLEWNSKFLQRNEELSSSVFPVQENISPNNHYQPSLDLIIQNNIEQVNRFLSQKDIPVRFEYSGPSC